MEIIKVSLSPQLILAEEKKELDIGMFPKIQLEAAHLAILITCSKVYMEVWHSALLNYLLVFQFYNFYVLHISQSSSAH